MTHEFDASVLREYDIRGIVDSTIGPGDAYAIGRTLATIAGEVGGRTVATGYDGRHSSPGFEQAVAEGIRDAGLTALRVGLGPTPQLYFAEHELGADAAIMVTGSHNPPDYNGFKLTLQSKPFFGESIQELARRAGAGAWATGEGEMIGHDVGPAYLDLLAATYEAGAPLSVAWDCGHGATGDIVAALVERLPGRHLTLYERIDGDFPAHHPDPTVAANLADLIDCVRREGLDLGIGFDGDGDRIGVVDGEGRIIWGDQLLTLLARDVLREFPGAPILADVKSSQTLFDEVEKAGGRAVMCRTGHSIIKAEMALLGAPLAGEMSGHIFFADKFFGHDDAIYVGLRFLDLVARSGTSAAALRDSLPAVANTPEIRVDCPDERKFDLVAEVRERLLARGARVNDLDGVRVTTEAGWWLLRASNTQPVVVLRCEAGDEATLRALSAEVRGELEACGLAVGDAL